MDALAAIAKLEVSSGDIIWVRLGGELNGQAWTPTQEDINEMRDDICAIAPKGVAVVVTHHLVDVTVIAAPANNTTWPPRSMVPNA